MSRVLCFDPSGNFSEKEGKGTTGWALFTDGELADFGDIAAEDHSSLEHYFHKHAMLIDRKSPNTIVIENFKLQPGKAMQQSWSELETSQLIGYMRMVAYMEGIKIVFQDPKDKIRVADPILEHMGVIEKRGKLYYCLDRKTNLHMRDAIRHGVFYHRYRKD